jgi:hypothetical protein
MPLTTVSQSEVRSVGYKLLRWTATIDLSRALCPTSIHQSILVPRCLAGAGVTGGGAGTGARAATLGARARAAGTHSDDRIVHEEAESPKVTAWEGLSRRQDPSRRSRRVTKLNAVSSPAARAVVIRTRRRYYGRRHMPLGPLGEA